MTETSPVTPLQTLPPVPDARNLLSPSAGSCCGGVCALPDASD